MPTDARPIANRAAFPEPARTWVPPEDMCRLAAYKLMAECDSNKAGRMAAAVGDDTGMDRRELGGAPKLISTAPGYLLGSEQELVVPGIVSQPGTSGLDMAKRRGCATSWSAGPIRCTSLGQVKIEGLRRTERGTAGYMPRFGPCHGSGRSVTVMGSRCKVTGPG